MQDMKGAGELLVLVELARDVLIVQHLLLLRLQPLLRLELGGEMLVIIIVCVDSGHLIGCGNGGVSH